MTGQGGNEDSVSHYDHRLEEGMYFGEVEIINDTVRVSKAEALTQSVVIWIDREYYLKKFYCTYEGLSEFRIRVHGEDVPLVFMLRHGKAYEAMKLFLQSELSTEGVMFWHAVDMLEHSCQQELESKFPDDHRRLRLTSFAIEYEEYGHLARTEAFSSKASHLSNMSENDRAIFTTLMMIIDMGKEIINNYVIDNSPQQV